MSQRCAPTASTSPARRPAVRRATPPAVSGVEFRAAREMFEAVKRGAKSWDVFIAVAGVADYRVKNPSGQKMKKANGKGMTLELEENPDILAWVAGLPKPPFCV